MVSPVWKNNDEAEVQFHILSNCFTFCYISLVLFILIICVYIIAVILRTISLQAAGNEGTYSVTVIIHFDLL